MSLFHPYFLPFFPSILRLPFSPIPAAYLTLPLLSFLPLSLSLSPDPPLPSSPLVFGVPWSPCFENIYIFTQAFVLDWDECVVEAFISYGFSL